MQAYSTPAPVNKPVEAEPEPRRRYEPPVPGKRLRAQNPNHSSGSHSRRRSALEHALARHLVVRAALVERCRRQEGDGDESYPWASWRAQLDQLPLESLGVLPNPRGRRDGDRNWTPYYIPDRALQAVGAFVALVKAIIRTLGYSGWRQWSARIRGWATEARAQLRARRMPQPMPPHTPREAVGSEISSKSAPLRNGWRGAAARAEAAARAAWPTQGAEA